MSKSKSLESILQVARSASRQGADVLKIYFGNIGRVQSKADSSIVSEADRESERVIREALSSAYPEYSILGEEGGLSEARTSAEGIWYVDPLDGTTNFVHGLPFFSTSLALEIKGQIVLAAIDAPLLGLSIWATRGGGAFCNDQRIQMKEKTDLSECLFATGFGHDSVERIEKQVRLFATFQNKSRGVRRAGAAVLDLCYTGMGVFDGFWERHLKPWDMAAGALVVEEAGGTVTTMEGGTWSPQADSMLAAGPGVHDQMVSEILALS